jgi:alcohol dehydrogenase (cytochrome c)
MPNDQWDLDWVFEREIVTLPVAGRPTKAVITSGKPGIVDALDVATGRYLFSIDPGLQNIITHIDPETGAKTFNPDLTPGQVKKTICPSWAGGKGWTPSSVNPKSKVVFMPYNEACMDLTPVLPGEYASLSAGTWTSTRPRPNSDGNVGRLEALDLTKHQSKWVVRQRAPLTSGVLATDGDVVFVGDLDRWFSAYDGTNGKLLWKTRLSDVPDGAPMTYAVNGKQYVAVTVGFGTLHSTGFIPLVPEIQLPRSPSSAVYVFALP